MRLDENVRDRVCKTLKTYRYTDPDYLLELTWLHFKLAQRQSAVSFKSGQLHDDQDRTDELGNHCGQGDSEHVPFEHQHEQAVQNNVQKAGNDKIVERRPRIPDCP